MTPTSLHAFKYKMKRKGPEAKEEVAAWDRSGPEGRHRAHADDHPGHARVAGRRQIVCDQDGMGDNPWADDVVRELQG